MIRFSPKKLRDFNKQLFAEDTFDTFLVPEAHFVTSFRTDFSESPAPTRSGESGGAEAAAPRESSCPCWKELRPIALQLVRGQAPKSFSVVLKLPEDQMQRLFAALPDEDPSRVSGFFLNIRYSREELMLTSGCTLKTFSLDKTWEKVWDRHIEEFLNRLGLI